MPRGAPAFVEWKPRSAMLDAVLTACVLCAVLALQIAVGYARTRDALFAAVLLGAVVSRIAVGFVNVVSGPLPGAEVDAVFYEALAWEIARAFDVTGHFALELGREGYASILAPVYLAGGRHMLLLTLVNAVFLVQALIIVYRICRDLTTSRRAVAASALAAFFPSAILYTAVPLREPVLIWALALYVYGALRFWRGDASVFNWRILIGAAVAVWLNVGFFVLVLLLPLLWNARAGRIRRGALPAVARTGAAVLGLALGVGVLLQMAGQVPKLPTDPAQLVSLEYLNSLREYKASYGTGYLGFAPNSYLALLAMLPVYIVGFLVTPFPSVASAPDAARALDGVAFLGMLGLAALAVTRARREGEGGPAGVIASVLGTVVVAFALGTANVGIAIRHRSAFAWLFIVLIVLWLRPVSSSQGVRRSWRSGADAGAADREVSVAST